MAGLSGTRLGRLQVGEVIGTGGFCSVYHAYDEGLDTSVAVKVLAENHSFDLEARERFLAEGRLLRRVEDPAVLQVFDVGETESNQPFLVLQYARGGTLADRLSANEATASATDIELLADMLTQALRALHDVGIVHRDLSPANVFVAGETIAASTSDSNTIGLISEGERLVLGDLGLAKDVARSSGVTVGAGTPRFASPEQLEPTASVGPVSDIYGASALLVHVAEGGPYEDELRRRIGSGLAVDPGDRPQTIDQWRSQLGDLSQLTPSTRSDESGGGALKGRRLLKFAAGALVLVLGLTLANNQLGSSDDPSGSSASSITSDVYAGELAAGWAQASWSEIEEFDPSTGEVELEQWGALSFEQADAEPQSPSSWVLVKMDLIDPADPDAARVAIRLNDRDRSELTPCVVTDTGFSQTESEQIEIAVPLTALESTDGMASRLSVMSFGEGSLRFRLERLGFGSKPDWVSDDASCGAL